MGKRNKNSLASNTMGRPSLSPLRLLLLVLLLSTVVHDFIIVVSAQQRPNELYQSEQFDSNVSFRQSVCAQQALFHNDSVKLENALAGVALRPVLIPSQYFQLNEETGGIDENYPGLLAVLLDEVARKAKFTWRDSYAVTLDSPKGNKTWTELLEWTTDTYDISVDWWAHSLERLKLGVNFPEHWYDASIIMVADTTSRNDSSFNLFSFLTPFTAGVWGLIVATVVLSGFGYFILESINKNSDKRRLEKNMVENIFLAGITFTSHFEFHPRTNAARLFTWSLSFWALIVGSAYTANLASFLVVKNTPTLSVNTVADAVQMNLKMCVERSTQADVAVTAAFPNARLIRKDEKEDVYLGIQRGECRIAITTSYSWDYWSMNADVNDGCKLNWIGRSFMIVPAGFATVSDSGTMCTSLVRDVINIHMLQMKQDGFIEDAWEEYLEKTATVNCQGPSQNSEEEDSQQLGLKSMGGIFVVHAIMSFLAIAMALLYKYTGWDQYPTFAKTGPTSRKAIRSSFVDRAESKPEDDNGDAKDAARRSILMKAAKQKTLSDIFSLQGNRGSIRHGKSTNRQLDCPDSDDDDQIPNDHGLANGVNNSEVVNHMSLDVKGDENESIDEDEFVEHERRRARLRRRRRARRSRVHARRSSNNSGASDPSTGSELSYDDFEVDFDEQSREYTTMFMGREMNRLALRQDQEMNALAEMRQQMSKMMSILASKNSNGDNTDTTEQFKGFRHTHKT